MVRNLHRTAGIRKNRATTVIDYAYYVEEACFIVVMRIPLRLKTRYQRGKGAA
jgi:hypothetical protein